VLSVVSTPAATPLAPSHMGAVAQIRAFSDLPDHQVVGLPALSPTMEMGTIAVWKKAPGEAIEAGDIICEVETDKATVDFEATDEAVMAKILVDTGVEVKIGSPICVFVEDSADVDAFAAFEAPVADSAAAPAVEAEAPAAPAGGAAAAAPAAPVAVEGRTVRDEDLLTPAARMMAESKAIDVRALAGTGRHGRITKGDIILALNAGTQFPALAKAPAAVAAPAEATAAAAPAAAAAPSLPPPVSVGPVTMTDVGYEESKASGMRKVISKRLTSSFAEVPHFYVDVEVELDALLAFRKDLKANHEVAVSVNDLVIRSAGLALRDVPEANAFWNGSAAELNPTVDISVAVATPTGLITPIVQDVDKKGLVDITTDVKDLAGRAKEGKLAPEEYQGGTFTISNLGMFGINQFSAVINQPQACIMAVGGGTRTVVVDSKESEPRIATIMTSRLSCDRRVVDEAIAAQYLQVFQSYMNQPKLLMM